MNSVLLVPSKETFGGAGAALYMNEQKSDISIVVEFDAMEHRFPAHSLFLCSMSQVMEAMLSSDMVEKSTKKIVIGDASPFAMKHFLKFIYTGEMPISEWHQVIEILRVAHKYQVDSLVRLCELELSRSLTLNRVCLLYEIAQLYSLTTLMAEAQALILHSAFVVFGTHGFEELSSKSLDCFLRSRLLNVENELTILHALKTWAKSECIRRNIVLTKDNVLATMKPFLKYIRFKSIPQKQRKFIPPEFIEDPGPMNELARVKFFVSPVLHTHMASMKFVVDLGSFVSKVISDPLVCVKISSDRNLFILGFRIVGFFRNEAIMENGSCTLIFSKEGRKSKTINFDLNSVPWKSGAMSHEGVWREVVAYLPNPARIDKFSFYTLSVKYHNILPTKWPRTRLESNHLNTELASVNIYTFGQCAGVTELFTIPASCPIFDCNSL